jgi:hypothetical protein
MPRRWIDEGLSHIGERAGQERMALERRQRQTSAIKRHGPELMRQLISEVRAVIDEFSQKAPGDSRGGLEFEALPHEGFFVTRLVRPRVGLECRADYEAHVVYCNMTRTDNSAGDISESAFNLNFTVDEADTVGLRHDTHVFKNVDEAVEYLLTPVLFPPVVEVR